MPVVAENGTRRNPPTHICSKGGGVVMPLVTEKETRNPLVFAEQARGGGACSCQERSEKPHHLHLQRERGGGGGGCHLEQDKKPPSCVQSKGGGLGSCSCQKPSLLLSRMNKKTTSTCICSKGGVAVGIVEWNVVDIRVIQSSHLLATYFLIYSSLIHVFLPNQQ